MRYCLNQNESYEAFRVLTHDNGKGMKKKVCRQKNPNLSVEMAAYSGYPQSGSRPTHSPGRALPPGESLGWVNQNKEKKNTRGSNLPIYQNNPPVKSERA